MLSMSYRRSCAETCEALRLVLGGFRQTSLERDPWLYATSLLLHRADAELASPALGQQLFEQVVDRHDSNHLGVLIIKHRQDG